MKLYTPEQVSVTFHDLTTKQEVHAVFHERDDSFCKLLEGGFKIIRRGQEIKLYVKSRSELVALRQITHIPLFINF